MRKILLLIPIIGLIFSQILIAQDRPLKETEGSPKDRSTKKDNSDPTPQNIIKLNIFPQTTYLNGLNWHLTIGYERMISEKISISVGVPLSYSSSTNGDKYDKTYLYGVAPEIRVYPMKERFTPPKGLCFSIGGFYIQQTDKSNYSYYNYTTYPYTLVNQAYEKSTWAWGVGPNAYYQWIFGGFFSMELGAGLIFQASESTDNLSPTKGNAGLRMRLSFNIGFAF